ncbi:hypothetical protein TNCV_4962931 [Trichonephila clavipes]|nr:hypothetical protein TNCV_4962931 [Trichonephila clavipes]
MLAKQKRIMRLNPTFFKLFNGIPNCICFEVRGAQKLSNIFVCDSLPWMSDHNVVSGWQKCLPLVAPFRTTPPHSEVPLSPRGDGSSRSRRQTHRQTSAYRIQQNGQHSLINSETRGKAFGLEPKAFGFFRFFYTNVFGDRCSLDEDDLNEFMTVYDIKEVDTSEVKGQVQLLSADLTREGLKFATSM